MSHRKKQKVSGRPVNNPQSTPVALKPAAASQMARTAPAEATRPAWLNIAILVGVAAVLLGPGVAATFIKKFFGL